MSAKTNRSNNGSGQHVFPLLLIQLVSANIIVAGVVAAVLYFTFDSLTELYFERLMKEFNISPTKLNSMFVEDVERSLFWGIGVALAVGVSASVFRSR